MDIEAITEYEGGPDAIWYMARGHVDKQQFAKEVMNEFELECPISQVEHCYAHNRPVGEKGKYVIDLVYKPGRGRYPVTIINLPLI